MTLGWLDRCLLFFSRTARRSPLLVVSGALLLLMISLWGSWQHLDFRTDRSDLISSSDALYATQERFLSEFPGGDDVVVMVEGGRTAEREAFVDLLAEILERQPNYFYGVFSKVELPFLLGQALMFLPEEELEEVVDSVRQAQPFLASLKADGGLEALFNEFDEGSAQLSLAPILPLLNSVFSELERSVDSRGRSDYHSPWGEMLFTGDAEQMADATKEVMSATFYHTLDEGRTHLLLLRLHKADEETVTALREAVSLAGKAYPNLATGITGEPVLEFDEMASSEQDSQRSAVYSLILVGLLFAAAFRQVKRPMAAIFCLVLGVGWTIGFTTIAIGYLNLLTISFATILIGLGIDFSIHLLFRYEEEFKKVGKSDEALDQALLATGSDIVVGALTTAVAFWAVGFAEFKGVSEIGIIAGSGVMLCLLSTLLVLPALITVMDRNRVYDPADSIPMGSRILLARFESTLLRHARWIVAGTLLFIVYAWPSVLNVGFDYNLLRLQDPTLESVQTELALIEKGGNTVLFAVSLADDLESAQQQKEKFELLPSVERVDVISELFPTRTERKIAALNELAALVGQIPVDEIGRGVVSLDGKKLAQMGVGFESLHNRFVSEKPHLLRHQDQEIREATIRFQKQMDELFTKLAVLGPGPIEDSLVTFQTAFFADLNQMVAFLQAQNPSHALEIADLPDNLLLRSVGQTGKLLLRVYPKKNIWEREALAEFVGEVKQVDEDVIGSPVMILHHTSILKSAFEISGVYALVTVVFLLLIYFRSVKWTLLALLPLALGIYLMLFTMSITGIEFNPANFMGLPLLLGIGLDFGIHVLHRMKVEGRIGIFDTSTGPATTISGLTTICGFGTMVFGGHQGVASLGFVLAAGVSGVLVAALLILPAVCKVFIKGENREHPSAVVDDDTKKRVSVSRSA